MSVCIHSSVCVLMLPTPHGRLSTPALKHNISQSDQKIIRNVYNRYILDTSPCFSKGNVLSAQNMKAYGEVQI